MEPAVTTSSPRIVLAEGSISQSGRMVIELFDARGTPKMIMIRWPAQATPVQPEAYADCASKIMRLFAKASVEPARSTSTLIKINRGHPQVVIGSCVSCPRRMSHLCLHVDVCDVLDLNWGLCQVRAAGWLVRAVQTRFGAGAASRDRACRQRGGRPCRGSWCGPSRRAAPLDPEDAHAPVDRAGWDVGKPLAAQIRGHLPAPVYRCRV